MLAVLAPAVVGVNVTLIVQEAAGAMLAQPAAGVAVNWPTFAPVAATVTPDTTRFALPVLLTVIVRGADAVLVFWLPKTRDVGAMPAIGAVGGAVAVPVTVTLVGEPARLLAIETDAVLVPTAVGVKVTLIVHAWLGVRVVHPVGV